ncbi:casein kinase II [Pseudozyma hubeiensis SY62]|uniref:Casein kinase II n=1 Tax=Pseudozyma hubeiensis (strain SY62) TaxID=1305764 RepID=R9NWM6_PSEHS|nr:casein kinase II [Pseudozyma hubeiensis SY62]GAC92911.1 casein kinase II [Pseudozyma hubeiensis SY62]
MLDSVSRSCESNSVEMQQSPSISANYCLSERNKSDDPAETSAVEPLEPDPLLRFLAKPDQRALQNYAARLEGVVCKGKIELVPDRNGDERPGGDQSGRASISIWIHSCCASAIQLGICRQFSRSEDGKRRYFS